MKQVQTLLRELGLHGTYKGYHYLLTTMEIALSDEKNLLLYTKMIFPAVAHRHQSTPSRVERDIRTAIAHCWNCAGRETLQEIAPCTLQKQPTIGEFIDILYWHLKFMEN